jgi:hypothetical protein
MRLLLGMTAVLIAACGNASRGDASNETGDSGTSGVATGNSPVPPDGPCITTAGKVVTLVTGQVGPNDIGANFLVVDDAYVYVGDEGGLRRVPITGGALQTLVPNPGDGAFGARPLAVAAGHVYWPDGSPPSLSSIPVADDVPTTPTYGAGSRAFAFDGVRFFTWSRDAAGQTAIDEIPIAGGPALTSALPPNVTLTAMAAGTDAVYAIGVTPPPAGGSLTTSLLRVPKGGGAATVLVGELSIHPIVPQALAVDDTHVYFSDGGNIQRVDLDGSELTVVPVAASAIALDAHAVYALGARGISKIDKATLAVSDWAKASVAQGPLVVHGGNVFWGESGGGTSQVSSPGAIKTICK